MIVAASGVTTNQFPVEQSILLLAVVLLGGVYSLWGAVVAAFFLRVFPQILDKKLGLPVELLTILFGVGVIFTLMMQPKGVVEDLTQPRSSWSAPSSASSSARRTNEDGGVIEVAR